MPKILEDRVKAIMRRGVSKDRAFAVATAALQKEGKMEKGSQKLKRRNPKR
jgi:hypothetical protein